MVGSGIKVYLTKIYPGQNPSGHGEVFRPNVCKVGGLPELLQLVIEMFLQIVNVQGLWWIVEKHSCNDPNGSILNMARGPSVASYNGWVSGLFSRSSLVNNDGEKPHNPRSFHVVTVWSASNACWVVSSVFHMKGSKLGGC